MVGEHQQTLVLIYPLSHSLAEPRLLNPHAGEGLVLCHSSYCRKSFKTNQIAGFCYVM